MKQKISFIQTVPFIAMLAVLSVSRIIFELTYSEVSYTITTTVACVLSVLIMAVALVKFIKKKEYFISTVSAIAIICLLAKLVIAAFDITLNFNMPLSVFEIIFLFVLVYYFVVGVFTKNSIVICLTILPSVVYIITWVFPNLLIPLRNTIGFNTYYDSHELFSILFGWIILIFIMVYEYLSVRKTKSLKGEA